MKRPLQLPLAIALALSGTDALALGLGTIHVNSKLNQPLDAEIPVLQGTAGEAEGLLVQLAAAEDFDRVGLNRSRLSVPLEFSLVKGSHGDMVIKVTSKEVIKEPFLDFLVEANWPKGRLLREYTVLLDPPVMAPATGTTAVTAAAKTPERAPTQALPEAKPKPAPKAKAPPVAAAPRAEAPSKPAPAPAAPAPKHAAAAGEYTVEAGDTLSGIARDVRPDESTNINQLMLAMLKQNPNAFYKDNINALKRGAILRIPSADQIKAVGSASEAAAQVHSQIEDWRGGAATKPTLVADTGTKPEAKTPTPPPAKAPAPKTTTSTTPATPKTGNERLELIPPKAGKDSIAAADRPGSGAGSAAATSELKSELARAKEALTSREQEATELKSRVKELEDIKGKTDRQLTLKDSEIADLQNKLKDLREQASKAGTKPATTATTTPTPAATPPSATPSTTSPTAPAATAPSATKSEGATKADKLSKEDIWGTAATTPETKTPGTTPSTTTPSTTAPSGTTPSATASTTPPSTTTPLPPSTATGSTTPGSTTPSSATATTPTPSTSTTPPSAGTTTASTTTPSSSTAPSASTPSASTTPPASTSTTPSATTPAVTKPVASTTSPVKPAANTRIEPLTTSGPAWYEQAWVKPAAIGAGALLLLAGLLGMRKRKAAAVTTGRGSIAGAFGDSPLRDNGALGVSSAESEEQALRDQLMHDPTNLGLHLELLSLLYAERNAGAFEDAAEVMHAHVVDPHQPEWLEVKAMGQELAPHNSLFADDMVANNPFDDEAVTAPHAMPAFDHDEVFNRRESTPAPKTSTAFDFDLDEDVAATPAKAPAASEPAFSFDNLPPVDFGKEAQHEMEAAVAPPPLHVDEDEFPGEDGVGTKLDLAKAYLDMGDPEGARSMLEEVLAEGNDVQKGEARRLMAEIK